MTPSLVSVLHEIDRLREQRDLRFLTEIERLRAERDQLFDQVWDLKAELRTLRTDLAAARNERDQVRVWQR